MNILFLCRGNVGRSTFAKYIFDNLAKGHSSDSAGTQTQPSNEGDTLREIGATEVIDAMKEEGIDVSNHARKKVTLEMVEGADMVVSMAEQETVPDFITNHRSFVHWDIEDPKGTNLKTHIQIKDEIKEKVKELVDNLS